MTGLCYGQPCSCVSLGFSTQEKYALHHWSCSTKPVTYLLPMFQWIAPPIPNSSVSIQLKRSKTDPFGKGVQVCVSTTGGRLCPVAAVVAWMVKRGNTEGPLLGWVSINPATICDGTTKSSSRHWRDPSNYGGHSFRSGAATTAAQQGIGDATIKLLRCWHSSAYQVYIKIPPSNLAGYSRNLAQSLPEATNATHSGQVTQSEYGNIEIQSNNLLHPINALCVDVS